MQDPFSTADLLNLFLVLAVVFGTYASLHKLYERHMIKKGVLKPLAETSWDDVRMLRDAGYLYWAIKRFRQLKRKMGRNLSHKDAWEQLRDL